MPKIVPIRRAYNVVAGNTVSVFIRLAVVASEICEITRNSRKIQTYSSSGSSKNVTDLGVNRKPMYNFTSC